MARGLIDRFNSFVDKNGSNGCWLWTGNKHKQGYGKLSFMGSSLCTHRISHELFKGPIPKNMMVCHSCDNTSCVNPEHLFLGTAQDNMSDKIAKGRHRGAKTGSLHHKSILSDEDVKEIRSLYSTTKVTQNMLAKRFSVSQSEISNITTYKKWRHIA